MSEFIGKELAHFRIEALLGQGGMGAVYRAWDRHLSRHVALKLMHPHLTSKPQFQERFLQEAQVVARLNHPAIVRVYAFDKIATHLYLIMELIEGSTLSAEIHRFHEQGERINLHEILIIGAQVAEALHYAHEHDVLHLDVKPGNIMLKPLPEPAAAGEQPFQAVVTDFGLARLLKEGTASGKMVGTLAYLSPEQCQEEELDGRADLYALGVILYEMCTGQLPFEITSPTSAFHKHVHEPAPDPRDIRHDLPPDVAQLILMALAKKPTDRFADAAAMGQALRQIAGILTDEATTQHPLDLAPQTIAPARREPQTPILPRAAKASTNGDTTGQSHFTAPPPLTALFQPQTSRREDTLLIARDEQVEQVIPLSKNVFTIGRLPRNDIVLGDRRISGEHLRLEKTKNGWQLIDQGSKNFSLLNGRPLAPNEPKPWPPAATLQIGPYFLRWTVAGTAPVTPAVGQQTPLTPSVGHHDLLASPEAIHLVAAPSRVRVKPGNRVDLQLSMTNMGAQADHFLVRQDGLPHDWVTIPQDMVQLLPNATSTLPIMIQPPADSSAVAGDHAFKILVTPVEQLHSGESLDCVCTVTSFNMLSLRIQPQQLRNRGVVEADVQNEGNTPLQCTLSGQDPANAIYFERSQTTRLIAPGDNILISLPLRPRRRPWFGRSRLHPFTITVRGESAPEQSEQGRMEVTSIFPSWLPPLLVFLLLIGLAMLYFSNVYATSNARATASAQTATAVSFMESVAILTGTAQAQGTVAAIGATATRAAFNTTSTAIAIIAITAEAEGDDDQDGIANYIEQENGLNKLNADTDGDGLTDGEEFYRLGTNANKVDTDEDGLTDYDEVFIYFTVPTNPDTDGDGEVDGSDPAPLAPPTATPLPTTTATATFTATPSPTPTATATPDSRVLPLAITESGTVRYNQFSTYLLTTSSGANAPVITVGDEIIGGIKYTSRGLLTFSLQSLPPIKTLVSAYLTMPQAQIIGDPFANLGDLVIETIVLEDGVQAQTVYTATGTLIVDDYLLDEGTIDVTRVLREALNDDASRFWLRFRFNQENMDGDNSADQYVLPLGSKPTLSLSFYRPTDN